MKKNLISIVILALLIVNIVLTSIMMFSVTDTNKKTAALVGDVASAISLDLQTEQAAEEEAAVVVPMKNIAPYTIADMMIPLKKSADGKDHYVMLSVTLSMDIKHKDYKDYGADLASREDLIKGEINDAVGQFTTEEANADPEAVKQAILERIQALFDSDFIFDVTLSSALYQ